MSTTANTPSQPSASFGKSIRAGLAGGSIAAVINVIIYLTAQTFNGGGLMLQQAGQSAVTLPISVVFWFSLSTGLVAGFLYALITIFTSNPKPIFWGISALVFILFFFGPITSAVGLMAILSLELMHIVTAASIISSIFRAVKT